MTAESGRCGVRKEAALARQSRVRVVLKMGVVFTAGLLLFILQFRIGGFRDMMLLFAMPFASWSAFVRDDVYVVWYGLVVLMLASVGFFVWSRKSLWSTYILIGAYWFWTYALLVISF